MNIIHKFHILCEDYFKYDNPLIISINKKSKKFIDKLFEVKSIPDDIMLTTTSLNIDNDLLEELDNSNNLIDHGSFNEDDMKIWTTLIDNKNMSQESKFIDGNVYLKFYNDEKEYLFIKSLIDKKYKNDLIYIMMSFLWSKNSYCKRKQTGSIIVKNGMIISDGYNGTPNGFKNECEENDVTLPIVLHAEANALMKLTKSTISSDNADLYCTMSPCKECAKLIHQAGIKRVIFSEFYRDLSGLEFLYAADIEITWVNYNIISKLEIL